MIPEDVKETAADGAPRDGVGHSFATPTDLAQFKDASDQMAHMGVPAFMQEGDSNAHVFAVAFDEVGLHRFKGSPRASNVAKLVQELESAVEGGHGRIATFYAPNPFEGRVRWGPLVGLLPAENLTHGVEEAYRTFVEQANRWRAINPAAHFPVQCIGSGVGAAQAVAFMNIMYERGVPDLSSRVESADGVTRYSRYLSNPGGTAQVAALFDPMPAGSVGWEAKGLPPSCLSVFQISAQHRHRMLFGVDQIIPSGHSSKAVLNVTVPGSHFDICGGYLRNGLSLRCLNLMRDYCNAAYDELYLAKDWEPADKRMNVIHQMTDGELGVAFSYSRAYLIHLISRLSHRLTSRIRG